MISWRMGCLSGLVLIAVSPARATTLNVSALSGGSGSITVEAGSPVSYQIVGELSDSLNEGLALVLFDLSFTGGALSPADPPTTQPMLNFVKPDGVTNPAGYVGTVIGGNLVQVGGSQNTIKNTIVNATFPVGIVTTGVAWPGSPQVLVSGSLTAPMTPGPYTLVVSNVAASVIRDGETGSGTFWAVDQIGPGTVSSLSIDVTPPFEEPGVEAVGSRYLRFTPGDVAGSFAYLVTANCAGGVSKYVGTPGGPYNIAQLVDNPVDAAFLTAVQWGDVNVSHVADIVPNQSYSMQADIGTPGSPSLMPAVFATTWAYGNVDNVGAVDVDDLILLLDCFAGNPSCVIYGSDMYVGTGNTPTIDVDDLLVCLDGFAGGSYPGPSPCP